MFNTYINKNSVVHQLNPIFKLVVVFVMFIITFFINDYIELILLTVYLIMIILYSNINIKKYLNIIINVRYILLIILIFDLIFLRFKYILFDIYRLIFIIVIICIYLNTTRNSEILFSFQKLLNKFRKYIPASEIALEILLILKFIPLYINKIKKVKVLENNTREKIRKKIIIYKKVFISLLDEAKKTIDVADINLYRYNIERKSYYSNKWSKKENYLLVLNILILFIIVYY